MPLSRAAYQVVLNVWEESWLYEIPLDLADHLPETTQAEQIEFVRRTLLELFQAGLIELSTADAWPDVNRRLVAAADMPALLGAAATWLRAAAGQQRFTQALFTDAGLAAYKEGRLDPPLE